MNHELLEEVLHPIRELYEDVRRKALMRLEYEGLNQADEIITPGGRYHQDAAGFAMDRYAYYVCYKCKKVKSLQNRRIELLRQKTNVNLLPFLAIFWRRSSMRC